MSCLIRGEFQCNILGICAREFRKEENMNTFLKPSLRFRLYNNQKEKGSQKCTRTHALIMSNVFVNVRL